MGKDEYAIVVSLYITTPPYITISNSRRGKEDRQYVRTVPIVRSIIQYIINCTERSSNYDNRSTDRTALMFYNTISNSLIVMILSHLYIIDRSSIRNSSSNSRYSFLCQ